jgi:hypothetical protein
MIGVVASFLFNFVQIYDVLYLLRRCPTKNPEELRTYFIA